MPGVDWFPGISQLKSTFQLITGDVEGALQTQENFIKECPVVSQVTSTVQLVAGDADGALETQKRCLGTINNVANGTPVIGHIKGVGHHLLGDHEGGNQALNAATRSTTVIGTGIVAGIASGGVAAIPAGIAAGATYDTVASLATDTPQGYYAAIDNCVKNPSAGAVFDAAVMPVGDGLAGYAGGQMGSRIATNVKVNSLDAARTAKMDQLNNGMFDPKGGMTSGQAQALGVEINGLTSQINQLQVGTPQFWFDPKTGQVTTTAPSTATAVPVSGYVPEHVSPKERQIIIENCKMQEDGLLADMYAQEVKNMQPAPARAKLATYKNQATQGVILCSQYPNVPVTTEKKLESSWRDPDRKKPGTKEQMLFRGQSWLHVEMPPAFSFTGAIQVNNTIQGLEHSFLRHSSQWQLVVPRIQALLQRLPVAIRDQLTLIENASNVATARQLLIAFTQTALSDDVQDILMEAQLEMYRFLGRNVTSATYLGAGANGRGLVQLYFKVTDRNGTTRVMVVCPSTQLFPSICDFGDPRPVRTITTVFFITWSEYLQYVADQHFCY